MIIALVLVTIFLGSVMKGAIGMGLPLLAIPVLSVAIDPPHAIAIVSIPIVATNLGQVWQFRGELPAQTYLPAFLAAGAVGTLAGTSVLVNAPVATLQIALGMAVLVWLVMQLTLPAWALSARAARLFGAPVGLLTGVLQGAVGISSIVSVTFLQALRLSRTAFVATISTIFLMFSIVQMGALIYAGSLDRERAGLGFLALLGAGAGMAAGNRLGRRLGADAFRRLVFVALGLIAVLLIGTGVRGML